MRLVRLLTVTGLAAVFAATAGGAAAGASTPVQAGSVSVVNALPADRQAIDVTVDEVLCALVGVEPGTAGALLTLPAGAHRVTVHESDGSCTGPPAGGTVSVTVDPGITSGVTVHDDGSGPAARVDVVDRSPLPRCRVRLDLRLVGGAGPVDVEVLRPGRSTPDVAVDGAARGQRVVEEIGAGLRLVVIHDRGTGLTAAVPLTLRAGHVHVLTVHPGAVDPVLVDSYPALDPAA